MNHPEEVTVRPTFKKTLKFVILQMLCFMIALIFIGFRELNMLLILGLFVVFSIPIFTVITQSMLTFTISHQGIVSSLFIMNWKDITQAKRIFLSPMFTIRTKGLFTGKSMTLPTQSLLSNEVKLHTLIARYAPSNHPILKTNLA